MNIRIQERFNHSENFITVQVSRLTQKVEIHLPNERSGLAFFSTDLRSFLGTNAGKEFGVMLGGRGPHKPENAYDIVLIHSLMIYTDLIEYNIVGDRVASLLRCFPFIKAGDIITTGQYMNYQTFNNLQFRPLLKNSFHSIHIDLRDTSGEELPFVSVGITRLVLMFKKASNIHFWPTGRYKMVASRQVRISFYRGVVDNVDEDSVRLQKYLGELQFHFCVFISSQLRNAKVLSFWKLLRQKLQKLLVVERTSRQLQRV